MDVNLASKMAAKLSTKSNIEFTGLKLPNATEIINNYNLQCRLAVLETLLHQQRQAAGSYHTREIQGALKSCQSLMAEVKRHSNSSLPECVEDCTGDLCTCAPQALNPSKPDNRSLLMTYAQTTKGSRNPGDSRNNKSNGNALTTLNSKGMYKNSKESNDKTGLLKYSMSPLKRKSASEA